MMDFEDWYDNRTWGNEDFKEACWANACGASRSDAGFGTGRIDWRTKEGHEEEVMAQVMRHGGFSVFWVTENHNRAHAAKRLQDRGAIVRDGGAFPWCAYTVPND
jgi:hypothetical protein